MKRTQNYSLKNRLNDKEGCICLSKNSALRCSNKALGPRCITLDRDYAKVFGEDRGLLYSKVSSCLGSRRIVIKYY